MNYLLVNIRNGHYKFYAIIKKDDFNVLVRWGRIGTVGQQKVFTFPYPSETNGFIHEKLFEKEQIKGYKRINNISELNYKLYI